AGSAANLVHEVGPLIKQSAFERAANKAKGAVRALEDAALAAPEAARKAAAFAQDPETHERLAQDWEVVRDLVQGKAKERLLPLLQKLLGKAIFENNPEVAHITHHGEPIAAE